MDALMAGWIRPLEAKLALARRVVGRNVVSVRRCDKTIGRIVGRRQLIATPESCPLETAVSRHREQAVPIRPARCQSARHPANVSLHIRIHLVQSRGAPVYERGLKRL